MIASVCRSNNGKLGVSLVIDVFYDDAIMLIEDEVFETAGRCLRNTLNVNESQEALLALILLDQHLHGLTYLQRCGEHTLGQHSAYIFLCTSPILKLPIYTDDLSRIVWYNNDSTCLI